MHKITLLVSHVLSLLLNTASILLAQSNYLVEELFHTSGCVAVWRFDEEPGRPRQSLGSQQFALAEMAGPVLRVAEGPLSGYSARFEGQTYFALSHDRAGHLNLYGPGQGVTVVAWVKWTGEQTGFVGGMWNEYEDDGKRQYGLFISLSHYNGSDQVCGHISFSGKPTPPFPYSIDYSASKQKVPANRWVCVAFTYDGRWIKSYLNGQFKKRKAELIRNTTGFPGYPSGLVQVKNPYLFPQGMGNNGSDFTVGAVRLKSGMGNFFKGQIGGLAIYRRALSAKELKRISQLSRL